MIDRRVAYPKADLGDRQQLAVHCRHVAPAFVPVEILFDETHDGAHQEWQKGEIASWVMDDGPCCERPLDQAKRYEVLLRFSRNPIV